MYFEQGEPLKINSLGHLYAHVSYLLTCDSKAENNNEDYAQGNIIAYYKDDELNVVNGLDLKARTALAKEIRKISRDSLTSKTDRAIQSKMRMELSYLCGLEESNLTTDYGFEEMVNYILNHINKMEDNLNPGEQTFLYVFHLHQEQMPHLHRFYKIK